MAQRQAAALSRRVSWAPDPSRSSQWLSFREMPG